MHDASRVRYPFLPLRRTPRSPAPSSLHRRRSKKRIDIRDLVLPWRPLYALLEKELFPKQRRTGLTNISETLLDLAEFAQRFFAPQETDEMLQTFLPRLDGSNLNVSAR